jgi:sugar phosphate isomerase/epimerase
MDENRIYLNTFCANFHDYPWLKNCVDHFRDFSVGVEFATYWVLQPDLPGLLDQQVEKFQGIPATIHAPFIEICNEPGSQAEQDMEREFRHAIWAYHAFHASSMVMHTNENSFPAEQRPAMRKKSVEMIRYWYGEMKKEGIHLTVENVGYPKKDNCLFDFENFIALFQELPEEVGCLIDTGHAMLNNWDIIQLIQRLGTRIRGYHLNNNNGHGDSHYPTFDPRGYYTSRQMEDVIAAIARYSPDADLILEYAPGPHITEELMHDDIRHVARIMKESRA